MEGLGSGHLEISFRPLTKGNWSALKYASARNTLDTSSCVLAFTQPRTKRVNTPRDEHFVSQ